MPGARTLGHLLHKHPDRVQSAEVHGGTAWVFYPEATDQRCTATLLVEMDRTSARAAAEGGPQTLDRYVNDLPYAAGSLLATAIKQVFGTAMAGRSQSFPDIAAAPMPLTINIPVLPCGGADLVGRLFAPLGWQVRVEAIPTDSTVPSWGDSPYADATLSGTLRLADALSQLYVLLPVLADAKHYWVSQDEVDKLLRAGGHWLAGHPERELITRRYLAYQRRYAESALRQLAGLDEDVPVDAADYGPGNGSAPLNVLRRRAVAAVLREVGARRVLDIGCGQGALLADLLEADHITELTGTDVSARALQVATRRLHLDSRPERPRVALDLLLSSVVYRDTRLHGFDAAVLMEVIEHLDLPRLPAMESTVFGDARPGTVIVTTPNAEYNVRYPSLPAGRFRHADHRFEWSRTEFADWAGDVATRYGYRMDMLPIGDEDTALGAPTQMAVFTRADTADTADQGDQGDQK